MNLHSLSELHTSYLSLFLYQGIHPATMSLRQMPRCSPDATPPLACPLSIQHTYSDSPRRDSQAHALPQLNKITTRGQTFQCNHTATYTIRNLKLIQQYQQSLQHDWTDSHNTYYPLEAISLWVRTPKLCEPSGSNSGNLPVPTLETCTT